MIKLRTKSTRLSMSATAATFFSIVMGGSSVAFQVGALQLGAAQPSLGSVVGNKYTNDSVGITYVFPKGWFVDAATMAATNDIVERQSATHDKDHQGSLWLMVSKFAEEPNAKPGSVVRGPSIILSGSTVNASDEHKTATSIQNAAKQQIESKGGLVVTGPTTFSVSGQSFSKIDTTINGFVYRGDAVTIRNHVRIEFQFLADSTAQLENLYKTLNTLQFRP